MYALGPRRNSRANGYPKREGHGGNATNPEHPEQNVVNSNESAVRPLYNGGSKWFNYNNAVYTTVGTTLFLFATMLLLCSGYLDTGKAVTCLQVAGKMLYKGHARHARIIYDKVVQTTTRMTIFTLAMSTLYLACTFDIEVDPAKHQNDWYVPKSRRWRWVQLLKDAFKSTTELARDWWNAQSEQHEMRKRKGHLNRLGRRVTVSPRNREEGKLGHQHLETKDKSQRASYKRGSIEQYIKRYIDTIVNIMPRPVVYMLNLASGALVPHVTHLCSHLKTRFSPHVTHLCSHLKTRLSPHVAHLCENLKNLLRATAHVPHHSKHRKRRRSFLRWIAMVTMTSPVAKQSPSEREVFFDTDSGPVGIDNRCSVCISHRIDDFNGPLRDTKRAIKGFGGTRTTSIKVGTIIWKWADDEGKVHKFVIPNSLYVPSANARLLSPQHWAQEQRDNHPTEGTGSETNSKQVTLFWNQRKHRLTVPLSEHNNCATFHLAPGYSKYVAFCAESGVDIDTYDQDPIVHDTQVVTDDEESIESDDVELETSEEEWKPGNKPVRFDLDHHTEHTSNCDGKAPAVEEEEEDKQPSNHAAQLLRLHHKFGHISMKALQTMAKIGILPSALAKCHPPVCSACMYAKATRKPWRSKPTKNHKRNTPLKPGEVVSVDQLVSPTPGLIAQMTGFLTTKRYKYATVFVDQATKFSYVHLQKTASAEETIQGKKAWEKLCEGYGIKVKAYHADNGVFKAHAWMEEVRRSGQNMTFAGVNAHHQNGLAENRIKQLQNLARAQIIHANSRWPTTVTANLWPYALRNANEVINCTPCMGRKDNKSPLQLFAGTAVDINPKHFKPFGCPAYVLDSALQQGQPFHKWKGRAKVGVYLGKSPLHGKNIALILDRETGLVSPQFHVQFDTGFQTVKQQDKLDGSCQWQVKAGFVARREPSGKQEEQPHATQSRVIEPGTVPEQQSEQSSRSSRKRGALAAANPQTKRQKIPNEGADRPTKVVPLSGGDNEGVTQQGKEPAAPPNREVVTRSGRISRPIDRLTMAMLAEVTENSTTDVPGEIFCYETMFSPLEPEQHPLLAFKASADPDTMYMHQALKQPDSRKFAEAMKKEVQDQIDNGNFSVIKRSEVPEGEKVLPTVWQMRRKRDIRTGIIKKWKARLNIDGSKMIKGKHYEHTYAPVASWTSIRLLLALVAIHNWHTVQLDYVQAFPQAPVEKDLYMEIPKGFEVEGGKSNKEHVLHLHKNLYGQKQAGRVWYQHLRHILVNKLGFTQSQHDECVFWKGQTMYILYTDDSILAGPDKREIEKIISDIEKAGLEITIEGKLEDFLGININRRKDGSIHLTQPLLITQIIEAIWGKNGEKITSRTTPASSSNLLSRHTDSPEFDGSFDYRSVIGKLNYLERGTRSDISYIVHQCARFTASPKREHGQAINWLGRYLKGTSDKGTIFKPKRGKGLQIWVDADFCGNWDKTETQDRDTARSRHGYIITYNDCPIVWKSQLQTEIALSSTESEYTGLSYALREAIPLMELLKELKAAGFPIERTTPTVLCEVFEDNSGALEIATNHKFRPRTKHLNVKLHHFRDYVTRGDIVIRPIRTDQQRADYLTKPVNEATLSHLRKLVMGW